MKNNKRNLIFVFIAIIIILVGIYIGFTYNSIVKKEERYKFEWNEVQNNYQRRLELVPNLVNVVKGGAEFEQSTLQKVTEARAQLLNVSADISPEAYSQQTAVQNDLARASNSLIVSVENYPDLKGTEAFMGLQTQLEGTERRIKVARRDFNEAIADYNSFIRGFPSNLVADLFNFKPKEGFQSGKGTEEAVEIKF